jgi:hypothetical protein
MARWKTTGELAKYLAGDAIESVITTNANLVADNIPKSSTVTWFGTNKPWKGTGPLTSLVRKFRKLIRAIRTDLTMWFENQFKALIGPRNDKRGKLVQDKIDKVYGPTDITDPETPPGLEQVRVSDFELALEMGRLSGKLPLSEDEFLLEIWKVRPSNPQASLGFTYVDCYDTTLKGPKNDLWWIIKREAIARWPEIPRDLKFEDVTRESCFNLVKKWHIINQLALRIDGKPGSYRLIKMSDSVTLLYETVIAKFISRFMKQSLLFAYHPQTVQNRVAEMRTSIGIKYKQVMNGDYSGYDDSQCFELLKKIYWAITNFFGLPEWLMVYIFAVNAASPVIRPDRKTKTIALQKVFGMARSGSGIFSVVNSLLTYCINWWIAVMIYLFIEPIGR